MTERAQNADFRRKPQIFADSPRLLEIPAFGGRRKPQKTADFRRKPKIFAENRRKPQIGLRHLRCVIFSSALFVEGSKNQARKKEPKPKLFGPDIFRWGGGLPREGVGAKKFGMSFETQGYKSFWPDIPGFCRDILGRPKSLRNNSVCVCVQFSFLKEGFLEGVLLWKLSRRRDSEKGS